MPRSEKRDIADFFKPYQRTTIPQKRSTPEPDYDESTKEALSTEVVKAQTPPRSRAEQSAAHSNPHSQRPLATPRSGRTLSIPIRDSPQATPTSLRHAAYNDLPNSEFPVRAGLKPTPFVFRDTPSSNRKPTITAKLVTVPDSDEEDTESLESLADILARKGGKSDTRVESEIEQDDVEQREQERKRLLHKWTAGRSTPIIGKEKMRQLLKQDRGAILNISRIVDDDLSDVKAQANIAQAEEEIEASTLELETSRQIEVDKQMLANVVRNGLSKDDDHDTVTRLLGAVDRTEALLGERTFTLFGLRGVSDRPLDKSNKYNFPTKGIPIEMWTAEGINARNRAYLSGFMLDRAERGVLSEEALRWTFEAVLSQPEEELRQAYISTIAADTSGWVRANVTPEDLHSVVSHLGAQSGTVKDSSRIQATHPARIALPERDSTYLISTIELLTEICSSFDFATLSKLCVIASRLVLDAHIMSDVQLSSLAEALLTKLTDLDDPDSCKHVHERIKSDLTENLHDPVLQAKFLNHLIPASANAAEFRTDLATTFLLNTRPSTKQNSPNEHNRAASHHPLSDLVRHVRQSPIFSATQSTSKPIDYAAMNASTVILDVALADGHPRSFLQSSLSSNDTQASTVTHDHVDGSALFPNKSTENEFNLAVDALADRLHELFASIADSGASHMRRTEAKDTIQAVQYRLLYAIRTKPRKRKHVFDFGDVGAGSRSHNSKQRASGTDTSKMKTLEHGKSFMQQFLRGQNPVRNEKEP